VSLRERIDRAEMMDEPGVPVAKMAGALHELDGINAWLGGHRTSLGLLGRRLRAVEGPARLLDVGAGGGGTARFLADWARRHEIELEVTLVDLHSAVCQIAQEAIREEPNCRLVRADAFRLPFPDNAFHFAHAALFLHHFPHVEIVRLLEEMRRVASDGVVVNDLHRHALAFHSIRAISRIFIRSPIVRHDGPLSVRRGFRAEDLQRWRLEEPGVRLDYRRRWPFRWAAWLFADGGTPKRMKNRV
jgi:SAM-dependent methyltransferase